MLRVVRTPLGSLLRPQVTPWTTFNTPLSSLGPLQIKGIVEDVQSSPHRPRFVLGFVTPKLLRVLPEQATTFKAILARDDTFKVNWNGFPVEIPGTVDLHGKAHAVGVFLKSHQDTLSCSDTLQALQLGVQAAAGTPLPLYITISDRAWAFYHSNRLVVARYIAEEELDLDYEAKQVSCYAHFTRALDKASHLMENEAHFMELQRDIREIHDVTSKKVGEALWQLFVEKWRDSGEDAMVNYLTTFYDGPWKNWKLYTVPAGVPVHNNGLEGINCAFKTNGTHRERADLGTFARSVEEWLYVESLNTEMLPLAPEVPPATWRTTQLLESGRNSRVDHSLKATVVAKAAGIPVDCWEGVWLIPSFSLMSTLSAPTAAGKMKQVLTLAIHFLHMLRSPSTTGSFARLVKTWKHFHVLHPKADSPLHYECTCPAYWRSLQCPHIVAIAIRAKKIIVPVDRSLHVLGRQRRPRGGRYAKAARALVRQDALEEEEEDAGTAFACSQAKDPCCYFCGSRSSTARNRIIFCDGCDLGYHQKCLQPTMKKIPDGDWYCSEECTCLGQRCNDLFGVA